MLAIINQREFVEAATFLWYPSNLKMLAPKASGHKGDGKIQEKHVTTSCPQTFYYLVKISENWACTSYMNIFTYIKIEMRKDTIKNVLIHSFSI